MEALRLVQANDGNESIQKELLYNIGRAHEEAFEIDRDLKHLRAALSLYEEYEGFAAWQDVSGGSSDAAQDLQEVRERILDLKKRLRVADQIAENKHNASSPVPPALPPTADWKRPRNIGIGLTVTGGAAIIGGVAFAIVGSRYRPNAQEQVMKLNDLGVPMDHPAWQEGGKFIDDETRKGNAVMAVGGTLAGVGAIGTGVGIYFLVKSGKLKNGKIQPSATLTPTYAGFSLTGRF